MLGVNWYSSLEGRKERIKEPRKGGRQAGRQAGNTVTTQFVSMAYRIST